MSHRIRSSKLVVLLLALGVAAGYFTTEKAAQANSSGPPGAYTGAPSESDCTDCHATFTLNSGPGTFTIEGVPANYTAGQKYTLTVRLNQASRQRYGFQITALNSAGASVGTFASTSARTTLTTNVVGSTTRSYVQHNSSGTSATSTNEATWVFDWTAPATTTGRVTFYAAGNAATNQTTSQDYIYTKTAVADPQTILSATTVTATNYSATAITAESIVSVFGSKLTTLNQIYQATDADPVTPGIQLPTTLGGTTIKVRDSQNVERNAQIFGAAQVQINYLIPAGTATGTATVTITTDDNTVSTGTINVVAAAPSIFTANASGSGLAAGYVVRVRNGQLLPDEPIGSCSTATGSLVCTTTAVSLGPTGDAIALVLFGTGFRAAMQGSFSATIGGTAADVIGAGAQGGFVGLDQANLLVPRSVTKDVDVDVILSVGATPSNAVKVKFTN